MADDNTISCEEIGNSLMASANVDPSLISQEWIRNHFRWIVWKLACMEVRLPDQFAQQCLTPWTVLTQLKYRYDREIDRCERSALKRIIEQVIHRSYYSLIFLYDVHILNFAVWTRMMLLPRR